MMATSVTYLKFIRMKVRDRRDCPEFQFESADKRISEEKTAL